MLEGKGRQPRNTMAQLRTPPHSPALYGRVLYAPFDVGNCCSKGIRSDRDIDQKDGRELRRRVAKVGKGGGSTNAVRLWGGNPRPWHCKLVVIVVRLEVSCRPSFHPCCTLLRRMQA